MQTESKFDVRYAETDKMGIVHHSNYAVWFEIGRTDYFKKTGISVADIEEMGVMLPLYNLKVNFKSPAKYCDEVLVTTEIKQLSKTRVIFEYKIINTADEKLIVTGETSHAWVNSSLKPINVEKAIPEVYSKLSQIFAE